MAEQPTNQLDYSLEMIVTGIVAEDSLSFSINEHEIPPISWKRVEQEGAGILHITVVLDAKTLQFGDNTIAARNEATRKKFNTEIQWLALTVRRRPD